MTIEPSPRQTESLKQRESVSKDYICSYLSIISFLFVIEETNRESGQVEAHWSIRLHPES